MRATVDQAMMDNDFQRRVGLRLKTVLNTADKVAFNCADFLEGQFSITMPMADE